VLFSFTAMAQPCADEDTVRSNAVTLITATSARINGSISHFTSGYTTLYLQYVRVGQTDTATTSGVSPLRNLTGLQPNTQYYYYYKTICVSGTNRQLGPYYFTTAINTVVYATERSTVFPYVKVDSGFKVPRQDTSTFRAPGTGGGDIVFKTSDSTMYYYNGNKWTPMAVDSAGMLARLNNKVDSVTVDSVTNRLYYWKMGVSYGYALPLDSAYVNTSAINDSTLRFYRLNGDSTDVELRGTAGSAIDTANKWVNTIYRKPGQDSIFFNKGGIEYAIKDSTGGGGGGPTGSGTTDYLARWTSSTALGTGATRDDGTNVGIGVAPGTYKLNVNGSANVADTLGIGKARRVPDTDSAYTIDPITGKVAYGKINVVPTVPGTVYVTDPAYGADSTGTYGSALAFQLAVATGKTVIVPPGLYILDSTTTLNTGQKILGFGKRSVLKTSTIGGGSPFNVIEAADSSIVDNLAFKGSGYAAYNAGPTFTYQNGVYLPGNYATVSNCYFDSISGSGIQAYHPSLSLVRGNKVLNCIFTNSSVGILDYALSEYMTVDNIITHSNDYGILRWGGNFVLSNSHIDYNVSAGYRINGSSNGDHGTNTNNSFNHNAGYAVRMANITIGELFTGCNFFFGILDLSECDNVVFDNCAIWTPSVLVAATSTTKTTTFTSGYQDATVTFTPSGTAKIIRAGLGKANTNQYIFNVDTIVVNDLYQSVLGSNKMVVWDSVGKKLASQAIPSAGTNIYNSDGTLTGDRTVSGGGYNLDFTGSGTTQIISTTQSVLQGGSGGTNAAATATPTTARLFAQLPAGTSEIRAYGDSILLMPALGVLVIDSLNQSVIASNKMMVWDSVAKRVATQAIPTGGGSGTVNSGTQYRLAYYAAAGTAVSEAAAITANRALISDANGVPTHSATTATEISFVNGVTSAIQTQLDSKLTYSKAKALNFKF